MKTLIAALILLCCFLLAPQTVRAQVVVPNLGLTVQCTTSPALPAGGTFVHRIVLTTRGRPYANQFVAIDDPIGLLCGVGKTDSKGVVEYASRIPATAAPGFYMYSFRYANLLQTSVVSVKFAPGAVALPSLTVQVGTGGPSNMGVLLGARFTTSTVPSNAGSTNVQRAAADLGMAIAKDFLSNPANVANGAVALVTCPAAAPAVSVPPLAAGLGFKCGVALMSLKIGLATSVIKVSVKATIDSTTMPASEKAFWKARVDSGACAISVFRAAASGGSSAIGTFGAGWTCGKAAHSVSKVGNTLDSLGISAPLTGTNDTIVVSIKRR